MEMNADAGYGTPNVVVNANAENPFGDGINGRTDINYSVISLVGTIFI
jgi:hypothetical protein